jgi:hypothetical protein
VAARSSRGARVWACPHATRQKALGAQGKVTRRGDVARRALGARAVQVLQPGRGGAAPEGRAGEARENYKPRLVGPYGPEGSRITAQVL